MSELPKITLSFPRGNQNFATQCDNALQMVLGAQREGIVDAPAISLADFSEEKKGGLRKQELNPIRFQVIARQLWLLGYLKYKPRRNISPTHQAAVQFQSDLLRFQADAGITQDGWLGDETWKALQELVSFETPITPSDWQKTDGSFRPAFDRALQLRLWAYGFLGRRPAYQFSGLKQKILEKVETLIQMLCGSRQEDWRKTLLDTDKILAGATRTLCYPDTIPPQKRNSIRCLLISITRVELWLLGFDVDIDNADDYSVEHFGVKSKRVRRGQKWKMKKVTNPKLKSCLKQFWQELLDRPDEEANELCSVISLDLLKALQSPEHFTPEADPFDEPDFSREAAAVLHTTNKIDIGYGQYRRLGMKLWDGIKRIWRWVTKGVKKIVNVANNLLRGFFRFATKSYIIVRTAFKVLGSSTRQYLNHRIDGTDPHTVLIDRDFDYLSLISPNHSTVSAENAIRGFSTKLLFSSKLVGLIVDLLSTAIQGVVGWARFLYILVKHYRELAPAYRALKTVS